MMSQLCLKILIAYNRFTIQTKLKIKIYRKKYCVVDLVCKIFEHLRNMFAVLLIYATRNKIEPFSKSWICSCRYLSAGNDLSAMTVDTYLDFDATVLGLNSYVGNDNILIAKFCPEMAVIKIATAPNVNNVHKSTVRFLGIEYNCRGLPAITIDIPKSHYLVDNEILSKAYILRYLEHLPVYSNWIFREHEYRVKIIDHDSNMFTLNCDQYILLEKDEYRIMHVNPNISSSLNHRKVTFSIESDVVDDKMEHTHLNSNILQIKTEDDEMKHHDKID